MKKLFPFVFAMVCMFGLVSCSQQNDLQEDDINTQYFFTARVLEIHEEYLLLEVFDVGNTNLTEGATVEVSTDVVAAAGCPEFAADECAKVVLARNPDDPSAERLAALAIYKTGETITVIVD